MKRLNFSIPIHAPKEKVWRTLLDDSTYRAWTSVFGEGSHVEGDWSEGSKMLFLGDTGTGISSRIARHLPNEYLSIEHLGLVKNGVEDFDSEETKSWSGALENYILRENDGITTLDIELDTAESHEHYFLNTWPKALQKVKELAEA